MDRKIKILDDITVNKIAAGEVIENPSSVVKELVENSLDAGASEIIVEIHSGGRQLIRVSDDGCGMGREDAMLSLQRHATSKIRSAEELFGIDTMGFRGEAIPSIASISKFTLSTAEEEGAGTLLMVEGGNLLESTSTIRSKGTTIEVKDLFYNVPVRKKFQRSPSYDTGEIQKMLGLLAMSNPGVKFQLMSQGKSLFSTPRTRGGSVEEQFSERIEAILGRDFLAGTCPFEVREGEARVFGFIGLPSNHRPNRTGQYLFVNRRGVQSIGIAYAIREGYGTLLPPNRHPVFVLQAVLPGDLVDVNVHPQKREVRLRQELALKDALSQGVQRAIGRADINGRDFEAPKVEEVVAPMRFSRFGGGSSGGGGYQAYKSSPVDSKGFFARESKVAEPVSAPSFTFTSVKAVSKIKVIGNLPPYILVDPTTLPDGAPEYLSAGLLCIDQRAAHKRVLFERLREGVGLGNREKQGLLIPLKFEVSADLAQVLIDERESVERLGWGVEIGDGNRVEIRALPLYCSVNEGEKQFLSMLSDFQLREEGLIDQNGEERLKRLAACSAVSRDRKLTVEESESLLGQLFATGCPYYCPQGKPTMVVIGQEEIAKRFVK